MTQEPIAVRRMPRGLRIYIVIVFGLSGGFFAWLAWTQPGPGHEVGYVMGFVFLWMALWAALRPELVVVADESGFEFTEQRLGFLLQFPKRRAAWSDVTRIDTRVVRGRYGRWLLTRIWVRALDSDADTRHFSVRSRSAGYDEFIQLLAKRTAGLPVEMTGYGLDTARALTDALSGRGKRAAVLLLVALIAFGVALTLRLLQHR